MAIYPFSNYVDNLIWLDGIQRHGGELDFLRALHSQSSLNLLRLFLQFNNPGLKFRLSSIWLDKFPICKPLSTSGCTISARELGDLGIVIRGRVNRSPCLRFRILQGKVLSPNWKSKGKSPQEIQLYEHCPAFDLYTSGQKNAVKLGQFDLKATFGFNAPQYMPHCFPFWNFLMFESMTHNPILNGNSLMTHHWDSSSSNVMSFSDGIQEMVLNLGANTYEHGARVDSNSNYSEWRRLFWTLWRHSGRAIGLGKLSGGPWRNTVYFRDLFSLFGYTQDIQNYGDWNNHIRFHRTPDAHIDSMMKKLFDQDMLNQGEGFIPPPENDEPNMQNEDESGGINWIVIDVFGERE